MSDVFKPESDGSFYLEEEEPDVYIPPPHLQEKSHVKSMELYHSMYKESLEHPEKFWRVIAEHFHWEKPWKAFFDYNFDISKGRIYIKWCEGAQTNVCYNVLDRHVKEGRGNHIAFIWEGNDPEDSLSITYAELLREVCKFANVLKSHGAKKGDRVAVYLPMIMQLPVVMLACARIGVIHSVVFGGFSAEALATRIIDAGAEILVTADGVWRGPKLINLKEIADEALEICEKQSHRVHHNIVIRHICPADSSVQVSNGKESRPGRRPCYTLKIAWNPEIDLWYHNEIALADDNCDVVWLDAEDPLFMLYTSGSTGKPKGVIHTQAGYLMYTATTFKYVFDYHPGDVYFCTADIGWITGHSYVVYGPMANCATSIIFEGVPFYPDPSRYWAIIDKYKVNKFYTAPTAIRSLMKHGEHFVTKTSRDSLEILGTVGEPINPAAWRWYYRVVGKNRCSVVDTYWQTETGGHVLTPLPGCTPQKPGSATLPFFGVEAVILNEDGKEIHGPGEGYLAFKRPWPGIMRTLYGNHERFQETYFAKFPGYYCTGDGARRDEDGYYWVTGRVDDLMNVSGHLLSTAELESALVSHPAVAEAAVVAKPHEIKGSVPYAFVTLKDGYKFDHALVESLKKQVVHQAPGLPKTRSGKIMRRILRQVAHGETDMRKLGDTSTLADESVIKQLYDTRPVA